MVTLPIITNLKIENYGLFPGKDSSGFLDCEFNYGMTLIVGINGLGKTTLVTMILRALTGPYDLTSSGLPGTLESVLPERPRKLQKSSIDFFSQRVSDRAANARVTLDFKFGTISAQVIRSLNTLDLVEFNIDGNAIRLPDETGAREVEYQNKICALFDLSSFVDVLLVLHHIVFLTDRRSGALWDENAQRQILRAIFLDKQIARNIVETERGFQGCDSRYRNTRAQLSKFQTQLDSALAAEKLSPSLKAQLEATSSALTGLTAQAEELEVRLNSVSDRRHSARLQVEMAKIENEQAVGAIEHAKYSTLMHLFPKMDDAARLLIARILSNEGCLVCGAEAQEKKMELEKLLKNGFCPACGSNPTSHTYRASGGRFETARMSKAIRVAKVAEKELDGAKRLLRNESEEYETTLSKLIKVRSGTERLQAEAAKLKAQLPTSSERVRELRNTVDALTKTMKSEYADSMAAKKKYGQALASGRDSIISAERKLSTKFSRYSKILMSEEARLSRIESSARITQSGDHFQVPAFVPEMTSADRPGFSRRQTWNDVSESQKELIDLAFRLALIDVSAGQKSSSFLMETPEASLDGVAMERVGKALNEYSIAKSNRLIVTSNLTNTAMITAMFGGRVTSAQSEQSRWTRVVNLLEEAAPNRALQNDRAKYNVLLKHCITGK